MKLTKTKLKQLIKEELALETEMYTGHMRVEDSPHTRWKDQHMTMSEEQSMESFWMTDLLPLVERYMGIRGEAAIASGDSPLQEKPTQFLERMIQFVRDQGY